MKPANLFIDFIHLRRRIEIYTWCKQVFSKWFTNFWPQFENKKKKNHTHTAKAKKRMKALDFLVLSDLCWWPLAFSLAKPSLLVTQRNWALCHLKIHRFCSPKMEEWVAARSVTLKVLVECLNFALWRHQSTDARSQSYSSARALVV